MLLENLRKTHTVNIIATWLCTAALSVLSFLQNGLTLPFFVTIGVMLTTSVLISVLRLIPFHETAKGTVIVCCIGIATLLCSILQGGSDRNFLASFFVLGLATLYFNSHIILGYGIIYITCSIFAALLNPAYIDGADAERASVLIKLVIYIALTILLFFATRKGEKMLRQTEEDAALLQKTAQNRLELSQNLNVIVENSNSAMEELSSGADAISLATQDMSLRVKGSRELTAQLQEQTDRVMTYMEQCHAQMYSMTDSFGEVDTQIKQGLENAKQANAGMNAANDAVSTAADATQTLLRDIGEIQKQLRQIESIATQTNLISINASIEAARAGQAGKSFSEVAKQVTELANHSSEVAKNISTAVAQLSTTSDAVYRCVNTGHENVDSSKTQLAQMQQSIQALALLSQRMDAVVEAQQDALRSTDAALTQMQTEMGQVADHAQHNAEQVENITASIEEQSASTREIAGQLQEIAALSAQSATMS